VCDYRHEVWCQLFVARHVVKKGLMIILMLFLASCLVLNNGKILLLQSLRQLHRLMLQIGKNDILCHNIQIEKKVQ